MPDRRALVTAILPQAGSERRACRWLGVHRSAPRYRSRRPDEAPLRAARRELAGLHPRWGFPLLLWALRQRGVRDNHRRREGTDDEVHLHFDYTRRSGDLHESRPSLAGGRKLAGHPD